MLPCIQSLVIVDGSLIVACICSTIVDCRRSPSQPREALAGQSARLNPFVIIIPPTALPINIPPGYTHTHRHTHFFSKASKLFSPQPLPWWRVVSPRGVDGVRGLVEVAREPAMTLPLQRQAMMHPAMPSQLTEQTRMFTRCSREHLGID